MLLNESATVNPALTKDLIDMWVPRCYRQGLGPACVHSYLFMHTLTGPEDDEDLESAAVSPTFRRAKMHLLPTWYMSLGHEMNYEDRVSFAHDVVGPTLYKYVWCEIFFPRGKYFSCNNILQTQRALLLQRVRVQSGRGLVEAKVSKHRKIADMQPEDAGAQVLDRGPVLEAAGRQEDVGPGAGVQLPTLRGGRRGARPGVRQHPAQLEIPVIKIAYILYIDDCMYYIVLCS